METSFSSTDSPAPDRLFAGDMHRVTTPITLLSGEDAVRGAVLGLVSGAGTITPAAKAGNTGGSGTIASAVAGPDVQVGVYQLVCIEPASNAGKFNVYRPDGTLEGVATVAVEYSGSLVFTITDATDFVAGDGFTITVAEPAEKKYKVSVLAATDGSQRPVGILAMDTDASAGDAETSMYRTGEFNPAALTFGAGHTAATVKAALEARQIYLKAVIAA